MLERRWFAYRSLHVKAKGISKKEAAAPDGYVAGLIHEGTYLRGRQTSRSPHLPARIVKIYIEV